MKNESELKKFETELGELLNKYDVYLGVHKKKKTLDVISWKTKKVFTLSTRMGSYS